MNADSTRTAGARIHAFVISWSGWDGAAADIARALAPHVDRLTVIHSDASGAAPFGTQGWEIVPDSHFYGMKFRRSLDMFNEDIMLQVQADATCDEWPALVTATRRGFATRPNLAVWAPDVDGTPLPAKFTALGPAGAALQHVAIADGIVWALSAAVCDRLRELDYLGNNTGWGIDWAAATFAHATGRDVVVDTSVTVRHPMSRGYATSSATAQMDAFLVSLNDRERAMRTLIDGFLAPRRSETPLRDLAASWLRGIRRTVRGVLDRISGNAQPPVRDVPDPTTSG